MTAITCDRCGYTLTEHENESAKLKKGRVIRHYVITNITDAGNIVSGRDLCSHCINSVRSVFIEKMPQKDPTA